MLISVVTVVYNGKNFIERTIQSVLNQTYSPIEYIIIDGGSTDGTLDVIAPYWDRISQVISEPDNGIYNAMNKGIRLAKGDWIHLLNADDFYVAEDVLERHVSRLDPKKTNYFDMFQAREDGTQNYYRFSYRRWALFYSAYLPHPGLVVSKQQYETVGLYDESLRIASDHDFILRMTQKYPGNQIQAPLTVMTLGGVSSLDQKITMKEFKKVTVKNGLPLYVAGLFWALKMIRLKIREQIDSRHRLKRIYRPVRRKLTEMIKNR